MKYLCQRYLCQRTLLKDFYSVNMRLTKQKREGENKMCIIT